MPHPFKPGDYVLVRRHHTRTLEPRWKGSFVVNLTIPTTVKVDGIASWVHASHLKPATSDPDHREWKVECTENPLKIPVRRAHLNSTALTDSGHALPSTC